MRRLLTAGDNRNDATSPGRKPLPCSPVGDAGHSRHHREGSPPMLTEREVSAAVGSTAFHADGAKLGTVEHFFVDDRTGTPSWVAVITGLFGTRTSIVPVQNATLEEGRLVLPVTRDAVRAAPEVGEDGHLGPDDEARLRRHYGLEVAATGDAAWTPSGTGLAPPGAGSGGERTGRHAALDGAPDDGAPDDGAMVRSEEQLRVGTERVA